MAPVPVSLSWAPGERLVASAGAAPSCNVDSQPALPRPLLKLFFAGHLNFLDRAASFQEKSARYRAMILECKDCLGDDPESGEQECHEALKHAHTVWHFIEVIYLTDHTVDDRHISDFLAEWYVVNYPEFTEENRKVAFRLEYERPRDDDEEFWHYLVKLAIVGSLGKVHDMLSIGKQEDKDEGMLLFEDDDDKFRSPSARDPVDPAPIIAAVRQVLARAPDSMISTRSDGSWLDWQSSCAMWAESEELEGHNGAQRLLGLLSGNTEKIARACATWEELMVASSYYGQYSYAAGGVLRGGVPLVSNACASASVVFEAPAAVAGGALVEAALGNVANAIACMEASLPSSWFAAHLCDTLVKAGKMTEVNATSWGPADRPVDIREFYLKEFARGLVRYRGCWRLAVDYYSACPSHGTSYLIDLLSQVPFEGSNDPAVEKVLLICKKRKLQKTAKGICERLGADCLNQKNFGGAMAWFARAGLYKRAQVVANLALRKAEREGAASQAARSLECIVNVVTNMGDDKMREAFDYMRVYSEMQTALHMMSNAPMDDSTTISKSSKPDHASNFASSSRRLVGGGGLPRRFWIVVVYEVARALEQFQEIGASFSRCAINEHLSALQLASGPHRSEELLVGLRGRLAFDAADSHQATSSKGELCTIEEAENTLTHCRRVLISSAAARINTQ